MAIEILLTLLAYLLVFYLLCGAGFATIVLWAITRTPRAQFLRQLNPRKYYTINTLMFCRWSCAWLPILWHHHWRKP